MIDKVLLLLVGVINVLMPSFANPNSQFGIKETNEALIGVNEVSLLMCNRFKDGVQFSDFEAFWTAFTKDEYFKTKMKAAYEGYQAIPSEMKDIDVSEGLQLAKTQVEYLPKFIAEFAKKPATENPTA